MFASPLQVLSSGPSERYDAPGFLAGFPSVLRVSKGFHGFHVCVWPSEAQGREETEEPYQNFYKPANLLGFLQVSYNVACEFARFLSVACVSDPWKGASTLFQLASNLQTRKEPQEPRRNSGNPRETKKNFPKTCENRWKLRRSSWKALLETQAAATNLHKREEAENPQEILGNPRKPMGNPRV